MRHLLRLLPRRGEGADRGDGSDRVGGSGGAGSAPAVTARHRSERRAVARRLHPDLGGDVEQYLAALAEVDRRHGLAPGDGPAGGRVARTSSPRRPRRSGLRRRLNRAARATRQRLPRRAPGARRYARL